jgi:PAS domain S-box-containing protein
MIQAPSDTDSHQRDGEARTLLRTNDWSTSPLGHPQTWPRELVAVVDLMMGSKFPMVVAWGPELGLIYNDAYAPIMGDKHPRGFGRRFQDVWHEIWSDIQPIIDNALAGRSSYFEDLPLTMLRKGYPEQTWFTFSYSPVQDGSGAVAGMYCTCVETTDHVLGRKRQEFQLALADRLRPLAAPDDVIAAASELIGRYLEISRVLYAEVDHRTGIFTVRRDWTSTGRSSMAGTVRYLDDFGPEIIAELRRGNPTLVDDIALDLRTARHAEAYANVEVRANLAAPLLKSGEMIAVLSLQHNEPRKWLAQDVELAQDMVERTWAAVESAKAQAELRAERDQSRYIFDSMNEGFALLGNDWKLIHVNEIAAQMAKIPRAELIGRDHWEVVPELVGTDVETLYRRVQATGRPETIEHLYVFPSGQTAWIDIRVYPSLEGGLAIFFRDITKRKQVEHELRESARRKDEFLAMLAHELRNPLAPIGSAAELLQMVKLDQAGIRQASEIIGRQVGHMTHLVDDLLDVSRVTRGLVELDDAVLDIRHIVTDAVEQVTPLIQSRRHRLTLHLSPDATVVMGDRKRLVQVIANLLNNAAKYTPEHGHIALKTEVRAAHVLLEVTDDGIGMAPELVSRVFDLFSQAERTSDRSSGGLGLGLSLVKSLVELHGGTVSCFSDGLGKGSRFSVCLPRLLEQSGNAYTLHMENSWPGSRRPLRILVVDDNVDAAAMLAMLLEASGHHVLVVHDSSQALQRAREEAPDVCMLDIGLPGMDGNELAKRLRAQPETADTVLIAVTGYGQESDRKRTLAAGFNHHLVKPVSGKNLAAILATVVNA